MTVEFILTILIISAVMSLWSLRDFNNPKLKNKILRKEKKSLFGVIRLPRHHVTDGS